MLPYAVTRFPLKWVFFKHSLTIHRIPGSCSKNGRNISTQTLLVPYLWVHWTSLHLQFYEEQFFFFSPFLELFIHSSFYLFQLSLTEEFFWPIKITFHSLNDVFSSFGEERNTRYFFWEHSPGCLHISTRKPLDLIKLNVTELLLMTDQCSPRHSLEHKTKQNKLELGI